MKGIVFSFKKPVSSHRPARTITAPDFGYILKRYGITLLFVFLLLLGLALGAVYAHNADSQMIHSLDFLFTTNLDARLEQGAVGTFCACFASDFIFLLSIYLLGTSPWGLPFELFVVLFKGFGTGLTAAYLSLTRSLSGTGFYLLVLLPGTFLFCIALVLFSSEAFEFSRRMFSVTVGRDIPQYPMRKELLRFSSRFLTALIMTFCAALLDTVLWTLFAGTFKF